MERKFRPFSMQWFWIKTHKLRSVVVIKFYHFNQTTGKKHQCRTDFTTDILQLLFKVKHSGHLFNHQSHIQLNFDAVQGMCLCKASVQPQYLDVYFYTNAMLLALHEPFSCRCAWCASYGGWVDWSNYCQIER